MLYQGLAFNQDITTKLDESGSSEKILRGIRLWFVVLYLVTHPFDRQASRVLPVAPFGIRHRKIVTFNLARASLALADHIICSTIDCCCATKLEQRGNIHAKKARVRVPFSKTF
jgi:hypothetical protein